jgi:peptide/nickel transport system substrate-binding protein
MKPSRRCRSAAIGTSAVLAATLLLAACTSGSSTSNSASTKGTLTLAFETDPYGWDPSNQPGYQNWAGEAVWDQLVYCDGVGKLTPDVADTWKATNNNTTFEAHIRAGMKFSDGTPVDSAAVKASFEYIEHNGGSQADYKGIKIATPDAQNISITWPEPQQVLDNKVCAPKIAPTAWLAAKKFDTPVGSGPYVLDAGKSTTGSTYTLTKNTSYWNAKNYPFKQLVVKVFSSDTAAVNALRTGQVDAGLVGQPDVASVTGSGLKVISFRGQTTRLLLTDHAGKVIPALGNLKVRQAMNMVFDKNAMVKNLYLGNAVPTAQVFREGSDAYIPNLTDPYPFDVAKAKQLMSDAGFANGFSLNLPTITGQNFETLMPYVTQQLALINIKVTQVPLSGANAITNLLSGKYPVVLWQLGNLGNSALQINVESTPTGYWDLEHQPDQYVDSRWTQIGTADPATSKKLQQEINQYLIDQAWFVPMAYMGNNFAYNPKKVSVPTESDQEGLTPKLRDFK